MGIYAAMHTRIGAHIPYIHCFPHHPPLDARDKQLGPDNRPAAQFGAHRTSDASNKTREGTD